MSTTMRAADSGGKIIIDGHLRHRHSALGFQKWKQRYVVFKVTNSGRLEFVLYKEPPAIPDNEFRHVAIEEYGGLETNVRLDSEKYAFAIITSTVTECFSVDSPQELTDWTKVIQEYLGKELVLNISIPYKQNILRAGKAQLRIRNLGFTITTCDNPPRAQGSWQVIHIRKYGGTDFFKFETGSRCPTGECLYTIQTDDNRRVKTLFSELSQHRPIFTDDRVGRRMTLERSLGSSLSRHPANRVSLPQPPANDPPQRPLYENRDVITSILPEGRRHSAAGGEETQNPARHGGKSFQNGTPGMPVTIDDHANRQYANWSAQSAGRTSPTKKVHSQLPIDYYSVTPPPVIQKTIASNSSSPETEKYMRDEFLTASGHDMGDEYSLVSPARSTKIVGDHIMFKEERLKAEASGAGQETGGEMYQNLKFFQGNSAHVPAVLDNPTKSFRPSDVSGDTLQPAVVTTETDWAPPNYTNVQLALEAVQSKKSESTKDRKRSEPSFPVRRDHKSLGPSQTGSLKGSLSTHELNSNASENNTSKPVAPDYYNMCVPNLPANSTASNGQHTSPTLSLTSLHQPSTGVDTTDGDPGTHTRSNVPAPRVSTEIDRRSRSPMLHTYDTLDLLPENKDAPVQHYDRLSSLPLNQKSSSSSPEPVLSPTETSSQASRYARKLQVIQHHHKYEYIDVELEQSADSASSDGVFSPSNTMEHPLTWMSQGQSDTAVPPPEPTVHGFPKKRVSVKETNSKPRKKHLPLQTTQEQPSDTLPHKPRAPAMSRVPNGNVRKPLPAVRKSKSKDKDQRRSKLSVNRSSGSSDESSSFEVIPDVLESLRKETLSPYHNAASNGNGRHKISNIQVELVKDPVTMHTPPPLPARNNSSDGEQTAKQDSHRLPEGRQASTDTPPLPPRPPHRVPLPPVQIDFTKTPTPPRPRVLGAPETTNKKYVALNFGDSAEFDDSTYTTVNVDQPVILRAASEQQQSDDRVSYSAVNFPVMEALHSTIRERMTERAIAND